MQNTQGERQHSISQWSKMVGADNVQNITRWSLNNVRRQQRGERSRSKPPLVQLCNQKQMRRLFIQKASEESKAKDSGPLTPGASNLGAELSQTPSVGQISRNLSPSMPQRAVARNYLRT